MLHEALRVRWPSAAQVELTIRSGGFLEGDFPGGWSGGLGWNSQPRDLPGLIRAARPVVESALTRRLLSAAAARTRILALGGDLYSDAGHAELVAVVNCRSGRIVGWTGKSYPTAGQASDLVHVTDLRSHLFELAGERVLILGCHDLNMFSARAIANQSPDGARRHRCDLMAGLVRGIEPTVVSMPTLTPRATSSFATARWARPGAACAAGGPPCRACTVAESWIAMRCAPACARHMRQSWQEGWATQLEPGCLALHRARQRPHRGFCGGRAPRPGHLPPKEVPGSPPRPWGRPTQSPG